MITKIQKLFHKTRAVVTGTPDYVRRYQDLLASLGDPEPPEYDLVYVLPPQNVQGWILDAICREIDRHCDAKTTSVEYKQPLPPAKAYFYSHYGYLRETALSQPHVLQRRNLLFYTHPRDVWYPFEELVYLMNTAGRVVSMCSLFANELIGNGVRSDVVDVALVGADSDLFQTHPRRKGKIGFCSGYVPRKGGDRIIELVQAMPDHEFLLCGKKWPAWERFAELTILPNLKYIDIPYSEYPSFYNSIDVFVSVSKLEGGPVPLIEAAMSNAVPVCSATGHAPDIISHGDNGFLFDPAAPIAEVRRLVEQALVLQCDVRATVEHLTWKRFSLQIQNIAGIIPAGTEVTRSHSEAV